MSIVFYRDDDTASKSLLDAIGVFAIPESRLSQHNERNIFVISSFKESLKNFDNFYFMIEEAESSKNLAKKVNLISTKPNLIMYFSINAESFAKNDLAEIIISRVEKKIWLDEKTRTRVLTCLHEAVFNAFLHGCLEIETKGKSLENLNRQADEIKEKLSNKDFAHRKIDIAISIKTLAVIIEVSDSGKGYDYNKKLDELQEYRGLKLIHSLADSVYVKNSGREIEFSFNIGVDTSQLYSDKISRALIMVVDDDDFSRAIIEQALVINGFRNIHSVSGGLQALSFLEKNETLPDIIFLDIMMPEIDGYKTAQAIKSNPKWSKIPIIFQTALTANEQRALAFASGATDIINKPINPHEIAARTRVHLENKLMISNLVDYKSRVEMELKSARDLQKSILPKQQDFIGLEKNYGIQLAAYFESCFEIGGDFWGFRAISSDEFFIYSVDFSGHGVISAINSFRMHAVMNEHKIYQSFPNEYLEKLNSSLFNLFERGQFATIFTGLINTAENFISYSGGGAPNPIIIKENKEVEILNSSGLPLGISPENKYPERRTVFNKGDMLVLFSDALIETEISKNTYLSYDEIIKILKPENNPFAAIKKLSGSSQLFKSGNLQDDLTINIYKRT